MKTTTLKNTAKQKLPITIPKCILHSGWWLEEFSILKNPNDASDRIINGSDKSCKR